MAKLILDNNMAAPDDVYELLTELHRGLEPEQSADVNARLILLLANHIGDSEVVAEATRIAREHLPPAPELKREI
ncbi:hypothetical protein GCM10011348_12640 [Marinobacterium nitratireducens]|uniref:DUF2783 domain-containing protein n=1 Tax=Marinobacterium nitratireducens TaxID=518897 RepID=A0A918DRA9_9GAMM|nr:DUF2783 domain-containing protein [Marinobacterium nitratireducens]GGO79126.1 hypothetical protein GCM10011348_12640 [Marinobacterium nitratireducens]